MLLFQRGKGADNNQLGLANLGGVFIVLFAGMIISCLIAVGEFIWRERIMIADPEVGYVHSFSYRAICYTVYNLDCHSI